MKKLINSFTIIQICFLILTMPSFAGIVYQDFEPSNGSGEYGWAINGAVASLSTSEFHSGYRSWKIESEGEYGGSGIPSQVQTYNINFEPSRHDRLSFWIKAVPDINSNNDVRVRIFDNGLYKAEGYEVFTTRTSNYAEWTEMYVLFSQLPNNFDLTSIDKITFVNALPGTYYIDDINVISADRVYQSFEPSTRSGSSVSEYGWKWNDNDEVGFSASDEPAYEGEHSWKIVTKNYWGGTGIQSQEKKYHDGSQSFWNVDLNPSQNDRLTFWIYSLSDNGLDNSIAVQFYDNGGHSTDDTKAVVWTTKRAVYGNWTKLTVLFSDLPGTLNLEDINKIQFQFYWPGTYYIDDIKATKAVLVVRVDENPSGVSASWLDNVQANKYELQESEAEPYGPWETIYEDRATIKYIKPLSNRWLRARWKEEPNESNPIPYVSEWSDVVKSIRPPALLTNPRLAYGNLTWEILGFVSDYIVQEGPSKNGPWTEIYRGGPTTLHAWDNYVHEGNWYRLKARLLSGHDEVFDETDWSPALPVTGLEDGYLKVEGNKIVEMDGQGDEIILKGVNLGNLLLIEPGFTGIGGDYTPGNDYDDDEYGIRSELVNNFGSAELLEDFRDAYIKEEDFDYLMRMGVTLVRLPIYYQALQDEDGEFTRFERVNWIIEQCAKRGIYVLLDLHGAPGAQSSESHSGRLDYNKLFEDSVEGAAYRQETIKFWRAVARNYAFLTNIAGYDILNEPFGAIDHDPSFTEPNGLWTLYNDIYNEIRAVDPYHIIVMESVPSHYDWETLPSPERYGWENVVYQLHYYGFAFDDQGQISGIKDIAGHIDYIDDKLNNGKQDEYDVPVLVGEFNGFNQRANWDYYLNAFRRLGWNWAMWTYKAHQTQYPTEWGLFMHEGYDEERPKVSEDSEDDLMRKFGKYTTKQYYSANVSLMDILEDHIAELHPSIEPMSEQTAYVGTLMQLVVNASDKQGDAITLSALLKNGEALNTIGASFVDNGNGTGVLSWTPSAVQVGLETEIAFKAVTAADKLSDLYHLKIVVEANLETAMISPDINGVVSESSETFEWEIGTNVSEIQLGVATDPAYLMKRPWGNLYFGSQGMNTSVTVNNIPLNGNNIYVRLWYLKQGSWKYVDYTYRTVNVPEVKYFPCLDQS
ncbi:MAG: cellulase family glycosylhydrolase [Candidatus Omnitrophica bacterium]|nr:cellulase family glycosylhydrolase [Candidatus Omnitrophota bacterium]